MIQEENVNENLESGAGLGEQVNTQVSEDSQEFNINKWKETESSLTSNDNNQEEVINTDNVQSDDNSSNDEDSLVWTLDDEEEEGSDDNSNITDDSNDNSNAPADVTTEASNIADYETLSNELGIEVKSKEDLVQKYRDLQSQVEEAKVIKVGNITNKKIETWQSYMDFKDEDLVKADLKAQGFNDDEIGEAVDTYKDNNMLGLEAKKIRKTLNSYISREQQTIIQQRETEAQKAKADAENARKEIKTVLEKTETMFGYKMAKTPDELKKVRENHYKYVTEKFINDITSNEKNVIEAAWLWRNRETILNAVKSSGAQLGKKEILDNITLPDNGKVNRIQNPSTGEFDAKKFAYGN